LRNDFSGKRGEVILYKDRDERIDRNLIKREETNHEKIDGYFFGLWFCTVWHFARYVIANSSSGLSQQGYQVDHRRETGGWF
jgi:hypothetical protein